MSETANWTVQVQIQGGKTINLNGQEQSDGFGKMSPTIPAAAKGGTSGTRQVPVDAGAKLLVISTSDKSGNLTVAFASDGGQQASRPVHLTKDAPIFLLGQELIGNQVNGGTKATAMLTFTNAGEEAAPVEILALGDLAPATS